MSPAVAEGERLPSSDVVEGRSLPTSTIAEVFSHLSFRRYGRGQATGSDELYLNRLSVDFRFGSFSYFSFRSCGWRTTSFSDSVELFRRSFKFWASVVAASGSVILSI